MRTKTGFTLIEVMMVLILSMLILGPAYQIFRAGSQTTLKGMKRIDLVLEGRRILKEVHEDLKRSCKTTTGAGQEYDIRTLLHSTEIPFFSYSFYSFPFHSEIEKTVSAGSTGDAPRLASRVTYEVIPPTGLQNPLSQLVRKEVFHPGLGKEPEQRIVSKNINTFTIKPFQLQSKDSGFQNQNYFIITLQLAQLPPNFTPDNPLRGIVLLDFYDVVYSSNFNSTWNHECHALPWHVLIDGPP